MSLFCLTCILWFDSIRIEYGIEPLFNVVSVFFIFSKIKSTLLFVIMILLCELTLLRNIILHAEREEQVLCIVVVEFLLFSTGVCNKQSLEERWCYLYWTVANSLCNLRLEFASKVRVRFTGNNCQCVHLEHATMQHALILSLTLLVHAQTHTTTHLLAFLRGIVRIFQRTNLEDVRVIPTFFQCGV